ncbi:MAG: GxxExxY protein [Fusobacteria bacterium]|nr:GxxExxY protein [Fusobacteriota bacterium]
MENRVVEEELVYKVFGIAMRIHNDLGNRFLEKVYENAMVLLLKKEGIEVENQKEIKVHYMGEIIGDYIADLVINNRIIVELKTVDKITNIHKAQLLNYVKATGFKVGLLINFMNEKLEYQRYIL